MSSKKNIKKRKIREDCWNLNSAFLKWLEERIPVYIKDASKMIDLEYHKINYKGEEYTQLALLEKLKLLLRTIPEDDWSNEYYDHVNEILQVWFALYHYMWW